MAIIDLPIRNFPKQQLIFNCPSRYVIVPKGRRFGATKGSANNYIEKAIKKQFKKGLWVDTVNANIDRYVERYFVPALRKISKYPQYSNWWVWRKQQRILQMGDSYIDFRSVDKPENIEGFGYDYAFLNEAGIILRDKYLWDNAIRPMLWDYRCHTIVAGTPKGKGVFYDLYMRGMDREQTEYTSMKFTSFDNPYLPLDVIREDLKTMPQRVVQQEIYADFLEDTGVVFNGVNKVAILPQPEDARSGHLYVMGVDIARLVDWTVITVYDRSTNRQVFQMRFKDLEWPTILMRIKAVSHKYNQALVLIDSTGVGEPIYEDLARQHVPVQAYHFTNSSKKDLIDKLANWIELRYIQMLHLKETVDEFNVFTYDISERSGLIVYNAPVGFHDDIVYAHALAIWALNPVTRYKEPEEMGILEADIAKKTGQFGELFDDTFDDMDTDEWHGPNEE